NLGETEADAYACRTKTQEKATEIGFNISEGSLADEIIAERLEELDLLYRTVDEIVFETRDEADLAKKELIEIQEIMNDIQSPTKESTLSYENELLEKREKIDAFQTSIKNKYLEKIDNYLSDFDKKFRKEGFLSTGMTREQAGNERALQFAKTLSVNTYEELDNAKVTLVANLPEYGITAEQATLAFQYFADCENKLNTVDGVVFHSRESAELGRKEYAEISKIITDIQSPSRESTLSYEKDLLAKREKIDAFQTSVKNKYLEKIDKYLSDFDKKFRKEGLLSTGMTREQAGNERALQFAKTLSVKTYEELDNAKIILVENLPEYGITEEQATLAFEYFADCEDKLNTVDGVVFHSREDAESGRKEYSEIAKIMSSVTPPTKDSLLSYEKNLFAVLGQIEQFETDVKLKYIKIINDYLEKFDNLFKQTGLFSKAETREAAAQDKALKLVESIATFSCTYADIDRARAELNALLPEIGIDISQAFKATAHLQDREDRLNTVDGIVFSTRDETALAKKEFIEIQKIMSNVTPPTSDSLLDYEQELFVVKSELEKFTTTVKNKYLDLIQKHLASFDEKFRRVSLLKVAETREEAAKERALKFVKSQTYNTVDDVEKARSGLLALLSRLGITAEQADEAMNYITKAENRINGVETPSKFGGFMSRFKK
ncbi:MAG: hypothetical protein J6A51_01675, partial [Clostridia bacterium]|nr:hypothetical protein [Clostridia bacterium]